jgi:hypothetical protein
MIGSGDKDSIHDVMVNLHMTELEAVLYMGFNSIDPYRVGDAQCVARDLADYLIKHLPEHPDDNSSERPGDEPPSERTD